MASARPATTQTQMPFHTHFTNPSSPLFMVLNEDNDRVKYVQKLKSLSAFPHLPLCRCRPSPRQFQPVLQLLWRQPPLINLPFPVRLSTRACMALGGSPVLPGPRHPLPQPTAMRGFKEDKFRINRNKCSPTA